VLTLRFIRRLAVGALQVSLWPARRARRRLDGLRAGIPGRTWAAVPVDAQLEYRHLLERVRASGRLGSATAIRADGGGQRLVFLSTAEAGSGAVGAGAVVDLDDLDPRLATGNYRALEWHNDDDWGMGGEYGPGTVLRFPALGTMLRDEPDVAVTLVRHALGRRRRRVS
jgi:hypothetical protein